MRRVFQGAVAFAACAALSAELPPERLYRTVEVGKGIYAFVSAETTGPIPSGNVVAIVGDDGVLVVDSGRFPSLARRIVADIRQKTDKPIRYLIHTHWHVDHLAADGVFRDAFPDVAVVSTDFTRQKMLEKQVAYLRDVEKTNQGYVDYLRGILEKEKDLSPDARGYILQEIADIEMEAADLAGAPLVPPTLTFAKELTVHLGAREVRIAFLGKGNTAGDAVVFVPDARVVVTGDLLVAPVPYGYGCHPAEWIATLNALMNIRATTIVPGHGPVMHDWDYAKKVIAVLEAIRAQVGEAVRAAASLEETRQRIHLEAFQEAFAGKDYRRGKAFRDFFVASAVDRAYQEAKGSMAPE